MSGWWSKRSGNILRVSLSDLRIFVNNCVKRRKNLIKMIKHSLKSWNKHTRIQIFIHVVSQMRLDSWNSRICLMSLTNARSHCPIIWTRNEIYSPDFTYCPMKIYSQFWVTPNQLVCSHICSNSSITARSLSLEKILNSLSDLSQMNQSDSISLNLKNQKDLLNSG